MTTSADKWGAVHRVRLGQVGRLLLHRYGPVLPDDDAGAEDLRILLHVKAVCYAPPRRYQALLNEIELKAPWLTGRKARQTAAEIASNPMKLKADTLGSMLNHDWMTRERLRLWQIGAVDAPADYLKQRRRQRDAERKWRKRRSEGQVDRDEYLTTHSTNRAKPWQTMGISRRTYYRQKAKGCSGTSVSAKYLSTRADGLVPTGTESPLHHRKRLSDKCRGAARSANAATVRVREAVTQDVPDASADDADTPVPSNEEDDE
jgi:hypothetical protein